SVVVDPLALAAVLEAVLEGVRVDPAEQPGEAVARLGEPAHIVVELHLEAVSVLAEMTGGGVRKAERVVAAAHLLGADARRGVGAEPETHLAAVVEREGARRAGDHAEDQAGEEYPPRMPPRGRRHGPPCRRARGRRARGRRPYRKALRGVSRREAAGLIHGRPAGGGTRPGRPGRRGRTARARRVLRPPPGRGTRRARSP